jgi:hypothetical protein
MNHNVCEACEKKTDNILVYDTAVCGVCGSNSECRDSDLIALYREIGFTDNFVWANLPRLRFIREDLEYSLGDIGKKIAEYVQPSAKLGLE